MLLKKHHVIHRTHNKKQHRSQNKRVPQHYCFHLEKQIRSSVPSLGILEKAEENARRFFESVFTKMGFTSVEVVFE